MVKCGTGDDPLTLVTKAHTCDDVRLIGVMPRGRRTRNMKCLEGGRIIEKVAGFNVVLSP